MTRIAGETKVAGVVSDTHGLLRPEVLDIFDNVDAIIHAGDIGNAEVLRELRRIAPVIAVRGNNDRGSWAGKIPESKVVEISLASIYVLHDLNEMAWGPAATAYQAVISGHSHRPSIGKRDGVLLLNPGSAGPRRFRLPITVARLTIKGRDVSAEIIELPIRQEPAGRGRQDRAIVIADGDPAPQGIELETESGSD